MGLILTEGFETIALELALERRMVSMYMRRLTQLKNQLHAYQEKTKNLEIVWHVPAPVPTVRKAEQFEYFYTWGRVEPLDNSHAPSLMAIFAKRPQARAVLTGPKPHFDFRSELHDPSGFMFILAPYLSVDDLQVIFHSHVDDPDIGTIPIGESHEMIRIVKGVKAPLPQHEKEAHQFTFLINREIATLLYLAALRAQSAALMQTELELSRLERLTFFD